MASQFSVRRKFLIQSVGYVFFWLADSLSVTIDMRERVVSGLVLALILSGCQQKAPSKALPAVIRLFDVFQPEDLVGKVSPEDVGWRRVEWSGQAMAPYVPPAGGDTNSTMAPATSIPE